MTLTPERLEELARSVEAGTMSLAQLQSDGLFQTYGGNDLLTSTDAALALVPDGMTVKLYTGGSGSSCATLYVLDMTGNHRPFVRAIAEGVSSANERKAPKSIIAALIRAGEGQSKPAADKWRVNEPVDTKEHAPYQEPTFGTGSATYGEGKGKENGR